MQNIALIVAKSRNNVIGKQGGLPWYLPADLRHFKAVTTGHPVIMGRKTFESIMAKLGKPLPERTNIVISRSPKLAVPAGVIVMSSLQKALAAAGPGTVFVIGGAQVYERALPLANQLYITEVEADIPGDVYFPEFSSKVWHEVARQRHAQDQNNPYNYSFVTLRRR